MARKSPSPSQPGDPDLALMRRVAADDQKAIEQLYDRFGPLVYRMAVQSMPSKAEAEDVVQEVFVRLWRTAGRFDPQRSQLVTWVMLLSRRHMVDRLRRVQSRVKPGVLEEARTGAAPNDRTRVSEETREQIAEVLKRIDALPELQKIVVTRAYLGGQTLKQIGAELNVPLGTIKSALSRALVRLRERVPGEELTA
ncbi:MAG: sigma-70 family RNA polymerase sigma factor [Phycisphaerales bacterium]|nr:sigma-70 family RNA polymerase sigma factor [Phycisphaerales bacterium]